jgi:hypothetical protein
MKDAGIISVLAALAIALCLMSGRIQDLEARLDSMATAEAWSEHARYTAARLDELERQIGYAGDWYVGLTTAQIDSVLGRLP